jgi:hypothetical protein
MSTPNTNWIESTHANPKPISEMWTDQLLRSETDLTDGLEFSKPGCDIMGTTSLNRGRFAAVNPDVAR